MQRGVRIICAATLALACALGASAQTLQLGQYQYTATTNAPARRQGDVVAAGITWRCQASSCTTSGPWPSPGVVACRALAAEIGAIASYGRQGVALSAADLATCNQGAAVTAIPIRPGVAAVTTAGRAVAITSAELSFVGGARIDTSDRGAAAVVIASEELRFIGGARIDTSDRSAPAVEITSSELSFVGRR